MRLRLKLVLLGVGVTVGSLLVLAAVVGVLLWRAEVGALRQEVSTQADALLALAVRGSGALPGGAEDLLHREGGASAALAFEDGELVWAAGANSPALLDLALVLARAEGGLVRRGDLIVAVRRAGRDTVQVARSLVPARRTLERYALVALGVGTVLAAVAGLLTAWVVGRVLGPLERLAARVRHLEDPLPVPGVEARDEVGDLARALDASLGELRDQREREALFLAGASHELRTPVAALLADVQHTRSRARPPEELEAALGRAERAGLRLRDLTANLLSLTRARRAPDLLPTDLLGLAGDVVDRLQPLAAARGLDLLLDGEAVRVRADPTLVARAVENLVGNALKFTPEGEVRVWVGPLGDLAEVRVEDSGPGVPQEVEALFEPFARGRAPGEGFGLGLAVVREVAQAHGGRVRLEPRPEGGTRARLVLPRGSVSASP